MDTHLLGNCLKLMLIRRTIHYKGNLPENEIVMVMENVRPNCSIVDQMGNFTSFVQYFVLFKKNIMDLLIGQKLSDMKPITAAPH